jgi:hypothetical protein
MMDSDLLLGLEFSKTLEKALTNFFAVLSGMNATVASRANRRYPTRIVGATISHASDVVRLKIWSPIHLFLERRMVDAAIE